jgi:hypothetical protein
VACYRVNFALPLHKLFTFIFDCVFGSEAISFSMNWLRLSVVLRVGDLNVDFLTCGCLNLSFILMVFTLFNAP